MLLFFILKNKYTHSTYTHTRAHTNIFNVLLGIHMLIRKIISFVKETVYVCMQDYIFHERKFILSQYKSNTA